MLRLDAVDRDRRVGDAALRIDELLEGVLAPQLAADDARRADLDDLVAGRGLEAGGLGVEDGIGQVGQPPLGELAGVLAVWNRSKS